VDSAPGSGAVFSFTLPAEQALEPLASQQG